MPPDRDTIVAITKINNLTEIVLKKYCRKFGEIARFHLRTAAQSRNKEAYALVKFVDSSVASTILSNHNHTINGTHVVMRIYQPETNTNTNQSKIPNLMSQNTNQAAHEQLLKENQLLKQDINILKKSLDESQAYSQTAYDTVQALRKQLDIECASTLKLKSDYDVMVQSYEVKMKKFTETSTMKTIVKEEPIDCIQNKFNANNHHIEIQVMKDRLDQAQLELGKCQTENAILCAKLLSHDQQFDQRYKELNDKYVRIKRKHDHVFSCLNEFNSKVYPEKSIQTETDVNNNINDDDDDITEIVIEVDPTSFTD